MVRIYELYKITISLEQKAIKYSDSNDFAYSCMDYAMMRYAWGMMACYVLCREIYVDKLYNY